MKKFVLVVVGLFAITALIGCNKKKHEQDAALDNMAAGVASENVVSVTDASVSADGNVPVVVVDNAEALPQTTGDMAAGVTNVDKPGPKQIQQALKNAGFYTGKIDGNIGPKTKKAIEAFQSQNGLKADGKVGPKTWSMLATHLNQTSEVANPTAQEQTVGQ